MICIDIKQSWGVLSAKSVGMPGPVWLIASLVPLNWSNSIRIVDPFFMCSETCRDHEGVVKSGARGCYDFFNIFCIHSYTSFTIKKKCFIFLTFEEWGISFYGSSAGIIRWQCTPLSYFSIVRPSVSNTGTVLSVWCLRLGCTLKLTVKLLAPATKLTSFLTWQVCCKIFRILINEKHTF